jgi:hypothetical protein
MNRFKRSLIGLLLLALMAPRAMAQNAPVPVSDYVRKTIERSDKGIAYAWAMETAMRFGAFALPGWSRQVTGIVTRFVDTNQRIIQQRKSLLDDTVCMRADEIILEMQMEKVRGEMRKALQSQSITAITMLEEVLTFLNDRYEQLQKGARDPAYEDKTWYKRWSFDPPPEQGWCCPSEQDGDMCLQAKKDDCENADGLYADSVEGCIENGCKAPQERANQPQICPFNSDYLPPAVNGFGCDAETMFTVLDSFSEDSPFTQASVKELHSLFILELALEGNKNIGDVAGGIAGGEDLSQLKRKHAMKQGCIMDGRCYVAPERICTSAEQCPDKTPCIDARAIGQCEMNRGMKCLNDGDCGGGESKCQSLATALKVELRGPFSLEKNQKGLLETFRTLRRNDGEQRAQSEELLPRNNIQIILSTTAQYFRLLFTNFNIEQADREAVSFAVGSDPILSSQDIFYELHSSIAQLAKLASAKNGIRGFVRDFAYFLKRSCMERPCSQRLDRILKIVLQDECFPFVSGDFQSDTEDSPRWKKCLDAAKLTELK